MNAILRDTVRSKVIAIIAREAGTDVDQVTSDSRLDALGIDSLGLVEAIFAIEEAFDVHIPFNANAPDQQIFDHSTVGAIVAAVEGLMSQRAA